MSDFSYPTTVSRTLNPAKHSYRTIVALHDHELDDADYNLTQDIQDLKARRVIDNEATSGCLSYSPFVYSSNISLSFQIPEFDALIRGNVLHIAGNLSADPTKNQIVIPAPKYWTPGTAATSLQIYVVFLEAWQARINPDPQGNGTGFYTNPVTGVRYIYPEGCVNAVPSNMLANDIIDPFNGVETTERVQWQWALRVQSVAPSYDFTKYRSGLDPGAISTETVWGQGPQSSPQVGSPFQFTNLGSIDGDAGLWRSGDGNIYNALGTLDGYSYAIPVAVLMQRNTGAYSITTNPFGCASTTLPSSGILDTQVSGRYDGRYADVVYAGDVVDTRSTVSLTGQDQASLVKEGFVDLISGSTRLALTRGLEPGGDSNALGSLLDYRVAVNATTVVDLDTIGQFDGYANGFGVSSETFTVIQSMDVNSKTTGVIGGRWMLGDVVVLDVTGTLKPVISGVQVQSLINNAGGSTQTPINLIDGQVEVAGIGTSSITLTFVKNLTGTASDPGVNPIYLSLSVTYPANTGFDLRQVPSKVHGGYLYDANAGKTLPVSGISYYETQSSQPVSTATALWAINADYSNLIFGTRVWLSIQGSTGAASTDSLGNAVTIFTIPRTSLNGSLTGVYVTRAWDSVTGSSYTITSRVIGNSNVVITLQGIVSNVSKLVVSLICQDTVQLTYNPSVKGVSAIEETVLCGSVTGNPSFSMDSRVSVVSTQYTSGSSNQVVLACDGAQLTGIAGDDVVRLIWVVQSDGTYLAVPIGAVQFSNAMVVLTVPATVNLTTSPFFLVCSIRPSLSPASSLLLTQSYIPYQGEGITARDYEVVFANDTALVTTNGTGASPTPGINDVFPYNRALPISTTLPARAGWSESNLTNNALYALSTSNAQSKVFDNIEHTMEVTTYTNDFIQPIGGSRRKSLQFAATAQNRGFETATPHVGFAIGPLSTQSSQASTLAATVGPITLYVDNILGKDTNTGATALQPLQTIQAAIAILPPVLRHACTLVLNPESTPISLATLRNSLVPIPLGDGVVRSKTYYALGNIAFSVQDAGCLVITSALKSSNVVIDCSNCAPFGDGPTSAFFINNSRVIFQGVTFQNFIDAAVKGINADVEFVNCIFQGNLTSGSFEESTVILENCTMSLDSGQTGVIGTGSSLAVTSTATTIVPGSSPNAFWIVERGSSLNLDVHTSSNETNITANTLIAEVLLNSSIECTSAYTSKGTAVLGMNSVLSRTVVVNPFLGGVTMDASSSTSTDL
jgi:hypothetical protein